MFLTTLSCSLRRYGQERQNGAQPPVTLVDHGFGLAAKCRRSARQDRLALQRELPFRTAIPLAAFYHQVLEAVGQFAYHGGRDELQLSICGHSRDVQECGPFVGFTWLRALGDGVFQEVAWNSETCLVASR
jgi:hypothetical protein